MRVLQIAVADDRNCDRALELRDAVPIGASLVELPGGARVERHGLYADRLGALCDFLEDQPVFRPAEAHLDRDGTIDCTHDGAHDGFATLDVAQAGAAAGLPRPLAERLARETVAGAGELLRQSSLDAGALRENVTSAGGTTEAALAVLMTEAPRQPVLAEVTSLLFAWRAVKHVASNGVVLAKGLSLVGFGSGQPSRQDAVDLACRKAGERAQGSVLASDGFFPFPDTVERAADAGVTARRAASGCLAAAGRAGIGAHRAGKQCNRIGPLAWRPRQPAFDRGERKGHRLARDRVPPGAGGQPLELSTQLPLRRRGGQELSHDREAQMRPPLVHGRVFRGAHARIPVPLADARTVIAVAGVARRASSAGAARCAMQRARRGSRG